MRSRHCAFAVCLLGLVISKTAAAAAPAYKVTVLLPPAGFGGVEVSGVSGASQVGSGTPLDCFHCRHALLWNGTAESVVDLHPSGFSWSQARGVSGASQVGFGLGPPTNEVHALLWNGTAESVVDLHPVGYEGTDAFGVSARARWVGATDTPCCGMARQRVSWTCIRLGLLPPKPEASRARARWVWARVQRPVGTNMRCCGADRQRAW